MLNVICERIGTTHSPEAVNILYDMISRNLADGTVGEFHLYTDQPDTYGPGIIVHALDEPHLPGLGLTLDHLIVGPLDDILKRQALLEEDVFFYWDGQPFPTGAKVIKCMGSAPQDLDGWVKHVWKIGGGTIAELSFTPNVPKGELVANIRSAIQRDCRWFEPRPAHEEAAIIVGGGPSLKDNLVLLRFLALDSHVFALNGVPAYLEKHGIIPDSHVILDAHPVCLYFTARHLPMTRYYASQCTPEVLDAAGSNLVCWHGGGEAMNAIEGHTFKHVVGGGSTGATRALILAYGLGYRKFHLFGMDSSYDGDRGHAYDQFDYKNFVEVRCGDQVFKTNPQLFAQAEDFKTILPDLISAACEVTVHGDGLLNAVATQMAA